MLTTAPFIVGNLWDVTDRDIDRLSISFMQQVFDEVAASDGSSGCTTAAWHLTMSRDSCKLRHVVGCAPVVYGLPVPFALLEK